MEQLHVGIDIISFQFSIFQWMVRVQLYIQVFSFSCYCQSTNLTIYQSVNSSVNQSINHWINQSIILHCLSCFTAKLNYFTDQKKIHQVHKVVSKDEYVVGTSMFSWYDEYIDWAKSNKQSSFFDGKNWINLQPLFYIPSFNWLKYLMRYKIILLQNQHQYLLSRMNPCSTCGWMNILLELVKHLLGTFNSWILLLEKG